MRSIACYSTLLFLSIGHMAREEIKSYLSFGVCVLAVSVNPFIIFCNEITHHSNISQRISQPYRLVGRPLWPVAGSSVHKVPGWRQGRWRWNRHTAAQTPGPCLVFLRWHQNSWFVWEVEECKVFKKIKNSVQPRLIPQNGCLLLKLCFVNTRFLQISNHFHSCFALSGQWRLVSAKWGTQCWLLHFPAWGVLVWCWW